MDSCEVGRAKNLLVDPKPVVAGLLPNIPPPPNALPVLVFVLDWPNSPVPDVEGAAALLAVDPNVPPLPNVALLLPPPNAPKPVEGFVPPNKGFVALLLLVLVLAKAPVDIQSESGGDITRVVDAPKPLEVPAVVLGAPRFPNIGLAAGCCCCWF